MRDFHRLDSDSKIAPAGEKSKYPLSDRDEAAGIIQWIEGIDIPAKGRILE
jgi:hypothetical protein